MLVGMQNGISTVDDKLAVSYKAKYALSPYDPAIMLPELLETYIHTKTCTWMFMAALFITAKIWRQPGCPSVGDWINCAIARQWNIIQHKKENELPSHETTWRKQKCISPSEISQTEKAKYCVIPIIRYHGLPCGSDGRKSACNASDLGSIPRSGRSPGEGNGNPLQYSCLENPMDRGAWQATVHQVAKSQTRLKKLSMCIITCTHLVECQAWE